MTSCPRSLPFIAYRLKIFSMSFFPVITLDVTRSLISLLRSREREGGREGEKEREREREREPWRERETQSR